MIDVQALVLPSKFLLNEHIEIKKLDKQLEALLLDDDNDEEERQLSELQLKELIEECLLIPEIYNIYGDQLE